MPALVIGADTPLGREVVTTLLERGGEVRAFVSNRAAGDRLKRAGAKVAVGDLSDGSHLAAAAHQAFTAVLVVSALTDGRPLAFAPVEAIPVLWSAALREAGVQRAIWIDHDADIDVTASAPEVERIASGERSHQEVARLVADLNDAGSPRPTT